uniref:Uncharacterized protein n=1 Tax=Romanomermis culicivorax TaxID=13658 RepID=A0A915J2D9_ROMCU
MKMGEKMTINSHALGEKRKVAWWEGRSGEYNGGRHGTRLVHKTYNNNKRRILEREASACIPTWGTTRKKHLREQEMIKKIFLNSKKIPQKVVD